MHDTKFQESALTDGSSLCAHPAVVSSHLLLAGTYMDGTR
jgi:hypothetical protein